jgi:hypothetical protein
MRSGGWGRGVLAEVLNDPSWPAEPGYGGALVFQVFSFQRKLWVC